MIKKNFCFFVSTLDSGGLENYLLRFLEYKASDFNKIVIFCKAGRGGQLEKRYSSISNLIIYKKKIGFFNPKDYISLYTFFKKSKIDTICDFTGNFAGLILFTANLATIKKRVVFYRGSTNHFNESKLRLLYNKFVKNLTYRYATNILSNSNAAFDFFFSHDWRNDTRFKVIYNGINPQQFIEEKENLRNEFNIPKDGFVVGHTGRYNMAKNHQTILKVAKELCTKYNDIYFLLCGNEVKDKLKAKVKKEKLEDRIILQNNREDIPKVLNTTNCYYFPSITEGQPNSLIEAMVSGIPIIASNIEPILETTPKAIHHRFKNPMDVEGFVAEIEKIYLNRDNISSYCCTEWARKHFDHKVLFEKFYNEL
ncbi:MULTISPECIES: glycosyltransferase [Aequorivita]|uniref:Glycosyltransferase n=1 Tax=Aequorivita iocasae TaxID=2803865 RepID=A0ABX7DPE2_9FLAO|nr:MULTISPECIES: glycosyltransferase [Aequorivita]QQX75958.1 glycosyltransferase [Aequorivita iocasae]UCA55419.1 glycosyltransferase [Aequorivita sp. F7]